MPCTPRRPLVACVLAAALAVPATGLPAPSAAAATISFGAGARLVCPTGDRTCNAAQTEPALEVDPVTGTAYAAGINGLPGGTNLFARPAGGKWSFKHKVDAVPALTQRNGLALGGGDSTMTIDSSGSVFVASLWAGANTLAVYEDGANTVRSQNYVAGKPNVDRQWIASYGDETLYMAYWDFEGPRALWVSKSTDGGLTWPQHVPIEADAFAGTSRYNTVGNIEVDQATGTIYQVHVRSGRLRVARSDDGGLTFGIHEVYAPPLASPQLGLLPFPVLALDRAGNVYVAFGDQHDIYLAYSTDRAETWSAPVRVNDGTISRTGVFPWIVAGDPGRVGVAWLGTSATFEAAYDSEADPQPTWYAYYAQAVFDLATGGPVFEQARASDDAVHKGFFCLRGLACDVASPMRVEPVEELIEENEDLIEPVEQMVEPTVELVEAGDRVIRRQTGQNEQTAGRELAEVVQMAIDTDGYVLIGYPDDCERAGGGTTTSCQSRHLFSVVVKQTAGQSLYAQ